MAAPDLITDQELIDRYDGGAEALRRFAGDKLVGNVLTYDDGKVAIARAAASKEAYGLLLAGFRTVARVQALVANDDEIKNMIALLVRFHLVVFKDDFRLPDGSCVFAKDTERARDVLRAKSSTEERSAAEELPEVGRSSLIRPRATAESPPRVFTGRGF